MRLEAVGARCTQTVARGRVPALGEQLRVDQHVDVPALVAREDLRELALGGLAGDALRLEAFGAEGLGEVVGVLHAGRVDDPGHAVEARLVEVRRGHVERLLIEQRGQLLLVELGVHLAAAQRHLGDRAHPNAGGDAHASQRRDHPPSRRLSEVEARGLSGEEVGDMARDQRARGGHADEDRARPVADRAAGLLAQRRVRLVADDDRVGARDLAGVAHEPLVGLDRHRSLDRVLAEQQRTGDALGVAALAQLAVELVDEVAPVREDQDAAGLRGLDEAQRGDRLAGAGGVLEPEALGGVGVLGLLGQRLLVVLALVDPVAGLLVGLALGLGVLLLVLALVVCEQLLGELVLVGFVVVIVLVGRRTLDGAELLVVLVLLVLVLLGVALGLVLVVVRARIPVRLGVLVRARRRSVVGTEDRRRGQQLGRGRGRGDATVALGARALRLGQQRRERARERIDLVGREHGAVGKLRLVVGEQSLQAQQQREVPAPFRRGVLGARVELGQRAIQRAPARGARRQRDRWILALVQEAIAHEASPRERSRRNWEWARPRGPLKWTRPSRALDFETEPPHAVVSAGLRVLSANGRRRRRMLTANRPDVAPAYSTERGI